MNRVTPLLCLLYAAASLLLLRCALVSSEHGSTGYFAAFIACSVLFSLGIVHAAWQREQLRAAVARLERATRPADRRPAIEDAVALELALACCERWWTSCGAEHDPTHCTRKDQTL